MRKADKFDIIFSVVNAGFWALLDLPFGIAWTLGVGCCIAWVLSRK